MTAVVDQAEPKAPLWAVFPFAGRAVGSLVEQNDLRLFAY